MVIVDVNKGKPHPLFESLSKKYHGAIRFCQLDCSIPENELICEQTFRVKSYPTMRLYPIGKRKRKSKTRFTVKADLDDIESEI